MRSRNAREPLAGRTAAALGMQTNFPSAVQARTIARRLNFPLRAGIIAGVYPEAAR
jgi:hypothetical protein